MDKEPFMINWVKENFYWVGHEEIESFDCKNLQKFSFLKEVHANL